MATNNAINQATGAASTVLQGQGVGTAATFTATPAVTSITLGGGTALANYVEGTWTPAISFGGGTTGITYSSQLGYYTRIGNQVFIRYYIVLTNKGSSTGGALITGLPITSDASTGIYSTNNIGVFGNITLGVGCTTLAAQVQNNATTALLQQCGSALANGTLADTNFANNSVLFGQLFYNV